MSNEEVYSALEEWLTESPCWQQDAARRILLQDHLTDNDLKELMQICLAEAVGKELHYESIPKGALSLKNQDLSFTIRGISDVQGVNAIRQTEALEFAEEGIVIIYGKNGSGKSGYSRILKRVSGDTEVKILPNIYETEKPKPSCTIIIQQNDLQESLKCNLDSYAFDERLSTIDVFDTQVEKVYVGGEKEPAYLPDVFPFLLKLVNSCGNVKALLDEKEKSRSQSFLPSFPDFIYRSNYGDAVKALSWKTPLNRFDVEWLDSDERELESAERFLKNESPEAKIRLKDFQISAIDSLVNNLKKMEHKFSPSKVCQLNEALQELEVLTKSQQSFRLVLDGDESVTLGSKEWKTLWNAARDFSNIILYPEGGFPHVGLSDRCPLCLQTLGVVGAKNLVSMNDYVSSSLSRRVDKATRAVIAELDEYPDPTAIKASCNVSQLGTFVEQVRIKQIEDAITKCIEESICAHRKDVKRHYECVSIAELITFLSSLREKVNDERESLVKLSNPEAVAAMQERYTELMTRRFLHVNKESIHNEIKRLKELHTLESAVKLTRTNRISTKINQLSEQLIAGNYIEDFQNELNLATEGKLQAHLQKQAPKKGRIPYAIKLHSISGSQVDPSDVLSEGEKRAVALSAFLADTKRQASSCPLVFDDPITSLDEDYEYRMLSRLVEVSKTRQVIVFTHRISAVVGIEELAGKKDCKCCIKQIASWPSGQYKGNPTEANYKKNPKSLLNGLQDKLAGLKRAEADCDYDTCQSLSSQICTQMRIAVEACIEYTLINQVVLRFRRSIATKNKLESLSRISIEDCRLLDSLMTKYSFDEHLSPFDIVPECRSYETLMDDRQVLLDWIDEFTNRPVPR